MSWAALGGALPAGQGKFFFPFPQHCWCHACNAASSCEHMESVLGTGESSGQHEDLYGCLFPMRKSWMSWDRLVWRRKTQGESPHCVPIPEGSAYRRWNYDVMLSVVPSDRTRDNGHILKHRRFLLNINMLILTITTSGKCWGFLIWRWPNTGADWSEWCWVSHSGDKQKPSG